MLGNTSRKRKRPLFPVTVQASLLSEHFIIFQKQKTALDGFRKQVHALRPLPWEWSKHQNPDKEHSDLHEDYRGIKLT